MPSDSDEHEVVKARSTSEGSGNSSGNSDVTARLGFNTPGLGSALTAQGFKNLKPEP